MSLQHYFAVSRQPRYSLLFALPLLVLYEGLAAGLSGSAMSGVRNGADVLLKTLFLSLGGRAGLMTFGVLLLSVGAWFVWKDVRRQRGALQHRVFLGMLAESMLYAAILGQVVSILTAWLLSGGSLPMVIQSAVMQLSLGTQLVVSLGAGIYEELLFRVLLISGITTLGLYLKWERMVAVGVAVGASALIFSAFHYVGPYGDPFTMPSFMFRAIAGLVLSGLYVTRGFGITAWSHALYDVGLAVLGQ